MMSQKVRCSLLLIINHLYRSATLETVAPPAYLPRTLASGVTLDGTSEAPGAQEIDPRDQSGPNVSSDESLWLQLTQTRCLILPWVPALKETILVV